MDEHNHNLDDSVESDSIEIIPPKEVERIENIFDEQDISPETPPDSNLEQVFFSGVLNTFLVTREDTHGEYSVIDSLVPTDTGPITHIHNDENEFFKVLDGTVAFQEAEKIIVAEPGDIIAVPAGRLHAFENIGDKPARMLTITTPDDFGTAFGGLEQAFREGGEPVENSSQLAPEANLSKIKASLTKYNTDIFPEARLLDNSPLVDADDIFYGDETNETIPGGDGDDIILGRNGQDQLFGLLGNDTLIGGSNEDLLDGCEGDDLLSSRESNDILSGGLGNDTLTGGIGYDTLAGGLGNDLFMLESGANTDYITDFQDTEDLIELSEEFTFEELIITQGTDNNINDTLISLPNSNEYLAILNGVEANTITSEDFQIA
jgi:mannose-6-phosphate isomerase-like protein (cupin superfamily)